LLAEVKLDNIVLKDLLGNSDDADATAGGGIIRSLSDEPAS
jgi:hypothetical protein